MSNIYLGNPICIEISNLVPCGSSTPIDNAIVEATVLDSSDSAVTGQAWPLSMPYIDGVYRGITNSTLNLAERDTYTITVTAKDENGVVMAKWEIKRQAQRRCS